MKLHPESARMFEVDEAVEKAKQAALRLLSGRAYSRKAIEQKLQDRGFDPRVVAETLSDLERLKLIDDEDFARRFAQERMRLRPMGRMMLARDLKKRGISEAVAGAALDEVFEDVDLEVVALDLLRARRGRYLRLDRQKALARMYGFLGRRGFASGVAREAAQQAWVEFEQEMDEQTSE